MTRHTAIWTLLTLLGGAALMSAFAIGFRGSAVGFGGFAVVSMILLALRDIAEASHRKDERQEEMQQAATRLGCSFRARSPFNVLGWSESFHLTCDGMKRQQELGNSLSPALCSVLLPKSSNVIERSMEDAAVAVFDYECDKSKSDDVTTRQTVFALRSSTLDQAHFALVPATWWDSVATNFSENVVIQHSYRLITDDAGSFPTLDNRLSTSLDGKTCVEAGEGFLLVYRRNELVAADDVEKFITTGLQIYSTIARHVQSLGNT